MKKSDDHSCLMPVETFVYAVVKAHKQGETIGELAKRIGKKPSTVYQRCYALRRSGVDLPRLSSTRPKTVIERAISALRRAKRLTKVG